jgi:hypothetical protein
VLVRLLGKLLLLLPCFELILEFVFRPVFPSKISKKHLVVLCPVLPFLDHLGSRSVLGFLIVIGVSFPPFFPSHGKFRKFVAVDPESLLTKFLGVFLDLLVFSSFLKLSQGLATLLDTVLIEHSFPILEPFHALFKMHVGCLHSSVISYHLLFSLQLQLPCSLSLRTRYVLHLRVFVLFDIDFPGS